MPTRLKKTCQRMTASANAANKGSAAGISLSDRLSSRPRAYSTGTVRVPNKAATPRMTVGVSPNRRNARLVR